MILGTIRFYSQNEKNLGGNPVSCVTKKNILLMTSPELLSLSFFLLACKKLFSYGSREMAVRVKKSMITSP